MQRLESDPELSVSERGITEALLVIGPTSIEVHERFDAFAHDENPIGGRTHGVLLEIHPRSVEDDL